MDDALSRVTFSSLSAAQPKWLEEVIVSYEADPISSTWIPKLIVSPTNPDGYTYAN